MFHFPHLNHRYACIRFIALMMMLGSIAVPVIAANPARIVTSDIYDICPYQPPMHGTYPDQLGCGQLGCSANEFSEGMLYSCNDQNQYYWGGKPTEQWKLSDDGTSRSKGSIACSNVLAYIHDTVATIPSCMQAAVSAIKTVIQNQCNVSAHFPNPQPTIDFYVSDSTEDQTSIATWTKIDNHELVPEDFFEDGTKHLRLRFVIKNVPTDKQCDAIKVFFSIGVTAQEVKGQEHGTYTPPKPFELYAVKQGDVYVARIPRSLFPMFTKRLNRIAHEDSNDRSISDQSDLNVYILYRFLRGAKRQMVNGLELTGATVTAWLDSNHPTPTYAFNQAGENRIANDCGDVTQVSGSYFIEPQNYDGTATMFGGKNDRNVVDGNLNLVGRAGDAPEAFESGTSPNETSELFWKLDPNNAYYISARWWGSKPFIDEFQEDQAYWRTNKTIIVWNPANGNGVRVRPVDYGPGVLEKTHSDIDLSRATARALTSDTDNMHGLRIGFGPAGPYGPCKAQ